MTARLATNTPGSALLDVGTRSRRSSPVLDGMLKDASEPSL